MTPNSKAPAGPPDGKFIVLVGLMGAGKTKLGKLLAERIAMPFVDSDREVEKAAGRSIKEIFEQFGEDDFRDGERRVIARIFDGTPSVIATGGGSFMDPATRRLIGKKAISVWLRADLETLVKRTQRRTRRPLLNTGDHRAILADLIEKRHPTYGKADIILDVGEEPAEVTAEKLHQAVQRHLASAPAGGEAA